MSSWTVKEPLATSLCLVRSAKRWTLRTFANVQHLSNRWEKMELPSLPYETDVA